MTNLSVPKTEEKVYSIQSLLNYYFSQAFPHDTVFVSLPDEDFYRLVTEEWDEHELDVMMGRGMIKNYTTFDHILSAISDIPDFLTSKQVLQIGNELAQYE